MWLHFYFFLTVVFHGKLIHIYRVDEREVGHMSDVEGVGYRSEGQQAGMTVDGDGGVESVHT